MTDTKQTNQKFSENSARIRTLLAEGRTTEEIMALVGVRKHIVGLVKYHMERQANQRISKVTGKPVRRYIKRTKAKAEVLAKPKKAQALIVLPKAEFLRMKEELETTRNRLAPPPVQIEIPVPQPWSHYTFWQRLRILFLGSAA